LAPVANVAVVGLGAMGSRIAGRFLDAGYEVVVWNRTAEKARPLADRGAVAAETPADAARRADAVVLMVADPRALRAVTDGPDGVLAGATPGTTVIQMSTVGPDDVAELASRLPEGVELLDAPVLGSVSEAEAGTLQVFAGGPVEFVEKWTPLLSALGPALHVGPVGAGTAAKLVANSTLLGSLGILGEALALSHALGLPSDKTFEVLSSTPIAAQAERRREPFESGEYPLRFALSLARKDADLISAAASAAGVSAKVAEAVAEWFAEAEQAGEGDADYSAVLSHINRRGPGRLEMS
jgi:3-hydroxyisobutyrate dehydrogenase/2-hydroxy-3-oxopropionate reductase